MTSAVKRKGKEIWLSLYFLRGFGASGLYFSPLGNIIVLVDLKMFMNGDAK